MVYSRNVDGSRAASLEVDLVFLNHLVQEVQDEAKERESIDGLPELRSLPIRASASQ